MDTHASDIELRLPAKLSYSHLVRQTVKHALEATPLPACWVYRLMLVIDELFMNAVKYGSNPKGGDTLVIAMRVTRSGVILSVSDAGFHGVTPAKLRAIIRKNTDREGLAHLSGRGLALIAAAWTDNLVVRRSAIGGLMVEVTKHFATADRDILPTTKTYQREAARGTETVVHVTESLLSAEANQEFQRVLDLLKDPMHRELCFDCSEVGDISRGRTFRLIELYLALSLEGAHIRWQHVSTSLEKKLQHVHILDRNS
ncbi:hypothetical protein COW46_05090 [Candidatus Gracilibacteria bacterium CG17_big_fil_post_rev_8_21_14_2_50_48_13]|nr:MAG: hypothetical protein COW46_05090 [Candidatus Gracilibacteria bacterium CG17_big_fil_post_rev_8_21_14_2_50_48_13]